MLNKVGNNSVESKRQHFVQTAASAAAGTAVALGATYGSIAMANKHAMKDEFKAAKNVVKEAKKQNLGKEAIKEAKKGLKELNSKVRKDALGFTKKMMVPMVATFGIITTAYGLILPAVKQYLGNANNSQK